MSTTGTSQESQDIQRLRQQLHSQRNPFQGLKLFELQRPEYREIVSLWRDLYEQKLWTQLAISLGEFMLSKGEELRGEIVDLFHFFIEDFDNKISDSSFTYFTNFVAMRLPDFPSKLSFLNQQLEKVKPYPEATASLLMQLAHYFITEVDDTTQAKVLLDKAEKILDENPGSGFSIHAKLHRTMSEYAKRICDYTLYYKSSMAMLCCVNLEAFSVQEQEIRGYYVCLAALLSDVVYNFGELMLHPIFKVTAESQFSEITKVVTALNQGSIVDFENLLPYMKSNEQLASELAILRQKMCLMGLLEMIFLRPSHFWALPFQDIATYIRLPLNEVEILAMKALSLGLIKGSIDETSQLLRITWVQPRYLNRDQIGHLSQGLRTLRSNISNMLEKIKETEPTLISSSIK